MIISGVIKNTQKLGSIILIPEKEIRRVESADRRPGRQSGPVKKKKKSGDE
jgi:hypothetical protein